MFGVALGGVSVFELGGRTGVGGHQRLDLRGDAMLSEWYSTDGRMYFVIGSGDQDVLGEEERRERDDEAVDNALSNPM